MDRAATGLLKAYVLIVELHSAYLAWRSANLARWPAVWQGAWPSVPKPWPPDIPCVTTQAPSHSIFRVVSLPDNTLAYLALYLMLTV